MEQTLAPATEIKAATPENVRTPANSIKAMFGDTDRMVRMDEWLPLSGLSRSGIYASISRGEHPPMIKIGARAAAFRASTLIAWLEAREHQAAARFTAGTK